MNMDGMMDFELLGGGKMPRVGLGCYKVTPDEIYNAVVWAAQAGYRHFDTAAFYENEEGVGRAVRECGVQREQLFVTTKLWPTAFPNPDKAIEESLRRLNTGYVDAFLLHWPGTDEHARLSAWEALLRRQQKGDIRTVGVSNFMVEHLESMLKRFDAPAINQIELHPWYQQRTLTAFCAARSIAVTAWRPICRGEILQDPVLLAAAKHHGKTSAQVALRWQLQHGNIVIPKSAHKERIQENIALFDFTLDNDEMCAIDALECGRHFSNDPFTFNG